MTESVSIKATSNGTRVSPGSTVRFTCLVSGLDVEQGLMTQVRLDRFLIYDFSWQNIPNNFQLQNTYEHLLQSKYANNLCG